MTASQNNISFITQSLQNTTLASKSTLKPSLANKDQKKPKPNFLQLYFYYKYQITNNLISDNKRQLVLADIQSILNGSPFPDLQAHLFGSSVNNLGFKNSDVDLTIINVSENHRLRNMNILANLLRKNGKEN